MSLRHLAPATLQVHTHPWHDTHHHKPGGGFRNVGGGYPDPPLLRSIAWMLGHMRASRKTQSSAPVIQLTPDRLVPPDSGTKISWLGHAAFLIQTSGLNILTDPMFGATAGPHRLIGSKRRAPLPIDPEDLPPIDLVLLSHNHYDHLDLASIRQLRERHDPLFLVPLGMGKYVSGGRVLELDWWQMADLGPLKAHATPAEHFSARTPFDHDRTLWCGWYLEIDDASPIYFVGDSAYTELFAEVGTRLGAPEVVLMPVGAYEPRWFMERVHVDPDQALQAFEDTGARHMVAMHWGTFDLADEPMDEPMWVLPGLVADRQMDPSRLHILPVGGQMTFP
jgi:N-acyl-phosphatidylethanolamine-hydrolysing phospholipase D